MISIKKLKSFKPSNKKAFIYLLSPIIFLIVGIYLSISLSGVLYVFGQLSLSIFFFQCFILLHETGHFSYFGSNFLNRIFGHFFAFISFIPFSSWISIHHLHHKWTGYRDKDPTTSGTVSPNFSQPVKALINFCWFFYLPLFTIGYRIGNYWSLIKLKKFLQARKLPIIYLNILIQLLIYILVFYIYGTKLLIYFLPAYVLSLMISDLFILSQHSHIEIPLSNGQQVKPIRYLEQIKYTRSISFHWSKLGKLVFFNFNLHELHHAYPNLPAYFLDTTGENLPNTVNFYLYLRDAKKLQGVDFIFNTSNKQIGKRRV